ncbi:MAG: reverse transcriptase domain-containing protein [Candidatus Staskawiczbacteria bacterium]
MLEANGFVATGRTINYAFWLLSKLLEIDVNALKLVIKSTQKYKTIFIDKGNKDKKKRRLDIPPDDLKKVQHLLLEKVFSRINMSSFPCWNTLTGYRHGKSNLDNIIPHLNGNSFIQIDLTDAFPSVNTEMIRKALSVLLDKSTVRKMFSQPEMRWFRKRFLTELNQQSNEAYNFPVDEMELLINDETITEIDLPIDYETMPYNVLWAMREIILWLTTFENLLPQGTPTAPFLFNLVMVDCKLPTIVQETVKSFFNLENPEDKFAITVYADNITISSKDLKLSNELSNNIILAIESKTPFYVNRSKVHCTSIKNRSPNITGLSIGKRENKLVTVPRSLQRRARGFLHTAIKNPNFREPAIGISSYLINVYGNIEALPKQIRLPYENLMAQIAKEQTPA